MSERNRGSSNRRNTSDNKDSYQKKEFKDSEEFKKFKKNGKDWIQNEFTSDTIDFCEAFGKVLVAGRLTTSQIRNIYGEIKRIEAKENFEDSYQDFLLLRPKIAYAAKRAGTRGIEDLRTVMELAHAAVTDSEGGEYKEGKSYKSKAFKNFSNFFEAILAYHKAEGGRE
jgi:CRISPR-associated protein Csm2